MAKCKSCGAEIIWVKMRSGKSAPCNPEPIHYRKLVHGENMLLLVTPEGDVTPGQAWKDSDLFGYISHFATCPNANRHRKGKKNETK